jgi:SAM-dependent methyltransferase
MSVCVCGWYLDRFDDTYMVLHRVNKRHPVHVVSNRQSDYLKTIDLPYTVRENTGLEWGAYNHYLMHIWDGTSNVLFMHDDITFSPWVSDSTIIPPEVLFDSIAAMKVDQCYIFSSREDDVENRSQHGRMVFMSHRFLAKAKEMGGFWYDDKNAGYTNGDQKKSDAMGCRAYNAGIIAFHNQAQTIGGDIHRRAYVPAFKMSLRGVVVHDEKHGSEFISELSRFIDAATDKLHLGCGSNHWDGYINLDLFDPAADIQADVRELPFADNAFDWIEGHHLIEHLEKVDAEKALVEWLRVLRPGGRVLLSCPDLVACTTAIANAADNPDLWDGFARAIYGQDGPGMPHRYGYCRASLNAALSAAGFADVEVKTVFGYRPTPSLLAIARKE